MGPIGVGGGLASTGGAPRVSFISARAVAPVETGEDLRVDGARAVAVRGQIRIPDGSAVEVRGVTGEAVGMMDRSPRGPPAQPRKRT